MSVWDCDQCVPGSFTDLVWGVCHVLESVWRMSGAARGDRGSEGPADRAEGRTAVVDDPWPEGTVHREADRFLRLHDSSGTQRTYAYYLVDYLRWLERECLAFD